MKLSIITINYNNKVGLEKTIKSIANQSTKNFEYIVIDGGSVDGSSDVIKTYNKEITYWVSEKDNGVYDAMNKGIHHANGEYLLMLNSGDYLANEKTLKVILDILNYSDCDIIYGDVIWEDNGNLSDGLYPEKLSFNYFWKHSLGHQAAFIKKSLHNIVGNYDTKMKISSDWKFFVLAICYHNAKYRHIDERVSICGRDGISCDLKSLPIIDSERNAVFKEYFSAFIPDYIFMEKEFKKLEELKNKLFFRLYNKITILKQIL